MDVFENPDAWDRVILRTHYPTPRGPVVKTLEFTRQGVIDEARQGFEAYLERRVNDLTELGTEQDQIEAYVAEQQAAYDSEAPTSPEDIEDYDGLIQHQATQSLQQVITERGEKSNQILLIRPTHTEIEIVGAASLILS